MDRSLKRSGSYEGLGLSVSTHPVSWMNIHAQGTDGFVLDGPGSFIDVRSLSREERTSVIELAVDRGLLTRGRGWRMSFFDEELEERVGFVFETRDEAESEAEGLEDPKIRRTALTFATEALAVVSGHDPRRIGLDRIPPRCSSISCCWNGRDPSSTTWTASGGGSETSRRD